jgi:hypothetical protein
VTLGKDCGMGLFYTNLTVYRPDRPALLTQLRRLRRTAFLGPTVQGHSVVFDKAIDEQNPGAIERLGQAVTAALSCSALAAGLHDDDVLFLWLFQKGRIRDRYDSCPAYFDPNAEPRPPAGGNSKRICRAFDCLAQQAQVEQLLRAELADEMMPDVQSELARHEALTRELGMPWFVAGLGYSAIAGGYVAEEFQGVPFEAV